MKSFFQKIWSFVLWISGLFLGLFRGREVRFSKAVQEKPAAPEMGTAPLTPPADRWLDNVKMLIFSLLHGKRELVVVLPHRFGIDVFSGLEVIARLTVRACDQPDTIHFNVNAAGMEIVADTYHALPLAPSSDNDRVASEKIRGGDRPLNVGKIELRLKGASRVFFDSGTALGQFFPNRLPIPEKALRAQRA